MNLKKALKIGGAVLIGVVVLTLLTLRVVGVDPEYLDPRGEEFRAYRWTVFGTRHNWIARPGLWLKGEVVREPVKDWTFADERLRAKTMPPEDAVCQLEVRTPYFIRHSITLGCGRVLNGQLYLHGHTDPSRMGITFPYDKAWTRYVARDPRVRLRIDGKIYEMIMITVTDRAESAAVFERDPIRRQKGPDGKEAVHEIDHLWRMYQMNVPDYSAPYQGPQYVAQSE